ncbi:hypothetical protein M406DRAFT_230805, partial [Cryphonectria parasitica EP155]
EDTKPTTSRYILPAESSNPPKVLILPDVATPEARVVSLTHPRYSKPSRYLICPETGAYEFTRISAPKTTPRSWLLDSTDATTTSSSSSPSFTTQVTKNADLYLATPIDPLFLTLPALAAQFSAAGRRMFLSSDDHLDTVGEAAPHLRDTVVRWPAWRRRLESRMAACCDTAEAGDETMFRFSEDKLFAEVLAKARRMAKSRLPESMEDKFVVKALEAPVLGVKRTMGVSGAAATTTTTTTTLASETSTAATSVVEESIEGAPLEVKDVSSAIQASEQIVGLQRLRIAFNFICSSYVPPAMASALKKMLAQNKTPEAVDFGPLDDYVAQLTRLRQEAMTARSASDYSRKRTLDEEDEDRQEKRRRKEEEEKRKKAGESRGVRELKKVNTAGMQKLSAFFKPK